MFKDHSSAPESIGKLHLRKLVYSYLQKLITLSTKASIILYYYFVIILWLAFSFQWQSLFTFASSVK